MAESGSKRDKFTAAYLDYYPLVFGSVYTRVNNLEDARDICQEIFIIFFQKLDEIDNIKKWLIGTMKIVVMQYYQKKKSSIESVADIEFTFVNGARDARIIIMDAMENIECDDIDRLILDLIAVHRFSYNEVAVMHGFTRRQVEYRYGQLINKILAYLKDKGINDIKELL